ncbi:DNA/RNA helicase domain-containing protein [Spartinivicinus poritis]|uniref:DUF2075 domain-containing protein n=1 Tax=Spartinivicinus poritis TaxID=2994640 RepID=A0ABT5UI65_9GAMM|nr:DNA/RNA helicase domain-containing protein [Spartinivicinus sp. A2-2]MDE1466090.1 DUF2075 domain-containing protein [Spartinivicinus sp. A2-2]
MSGSKKETNHPSYQAWSYAALIEDYNETVRKELIQLQPCAYLHNLKSDNAVNDPFYFEYISKAPVFISPDALKLAEFLKKHVKYGDTNDIMYRIEHGSIKPSKNLADCLSSMLTGNREFVLLDEQKLVYETAIDLAHQAVKGKKQTLIVRGGPGTGKSVIAINLLVELTKREMLVQYVSKNAAPRAVFKEKLTGSLKKSNIDNMFKGSGSYIDIEENIFDVLVVDESHRLNEKSGLYGNKGENQIKEIIVGSKLSIFFIDEAQRVTLKDIGSEASIKYWASLQGAEVSELDLVSQFRCNGSDGYLAWVDNVLQIRETANTTLDDIDYEVKVFDDPNKLKEAIFDKNRLTNKARMVAGYCWDWKSKKNQDVFDIVIPKYNFKAQWNLTDDGSLWMIAENSVNQVGCIHTCQGLEVDYIGVIIGEDFVVRDGHVVTDACKRSSNDRSIRGFKKLLKESPEEAKQVTKEIIKNTYRTLMTRGQKGCYIFCIDPETNEYFKELAKRKEDEIINAVNLYSGLDFPVVPLEEAKPYEGYVPIYDASIANGEFATSEYNWIRLPEVFATREGMFVLRVVGESMNRRIPNGSWCLFSANSDVVRNNKIVLAKSSCIEDPDHGGSYTVKVYQHEKTLQDGEVVNQRVILKPDSNAYLIITIPKPLAAVYLNSMAI